MARLMKVERKVKEGEILNKWFHNRMIRRNQNILNATTGSPGCLSEGTIVEGQTQSLGDLYSSGKRIIDTVSISQPPCKQGKHGGYYPKKSKSEIIKSGIKEVFEIELEDGRKVIATSDHIFFKIVENSFKEEVVKNLKVGDVIKTYEIGRKLNNVSNKN